jgi:cell division septum initiation protein DivIVA
MNFRRHIRGQTRNIDDAASVDSGKSQRDEITNKIKSVYQELENLKRKNEELEKQLKGSISSDTPCDENQVWSEIQEYTIKIMERLSIHATSPEDSIRSTESNTVNVPTEKTRTVVDQVVGLQGTTKPETDPVKVMKSPQLNLLSGESIASETPGLGDAPSSTEMDNLISDLNKEDTLFGDSSFLSDVLAQFNFQ